MVLVKRSRKISQEKLNQVAALLKNASVVAATITDPEVPRKLVDFAIATFGRLHVVINNAGAMTVSAIEDVDIEAIYQMVRLNVESVYRMAHTALRYFKQAGSRFLIKDD